MDRPIGFPRTPVGGLLLEGAEGWSFDVRAGLIIGTCGDDPGLLRITTVAPNCLPHPLTHETCLTLVADFAGVADDLTPAEWDAAASVTGPYGSAYFDRPPNRVFVWYCCRTPGLIVGTYLCPLPLGRHAKALRAQCDMMITSAVFDRRAWGADDELTKLVIALMAADDPLTDA